MKLIWFIWLIFLATVECTKHEHMYLWLNT